MKNIYLFFILTLFLSNWTIAQIKLEVEIGNLRNDSGQILIALLDVEENQINGQIGQINKGKSVVIFENLKPEKYAIKYFHDENANSKMDKNFIGIPKEGYGISNNAYGIFGPDEFEKQLFVLTNDSKINLRTTY